MQSPNIRDFDQPSIYSQTILLVLNSIKQYKSRIDYIFVFSV